jgi:hypothetical protein
VRQAPRRSEFTVLDLLQSIILILVRRAKRAVEATVYEEAREELRGGTSAFFVDLRRGSPASPECPAFLGVLFVVQGGEASKRNEAIALAACS